MQHRSGTPLPSLRRLPAYHRRALQVVEEGPTFVSSEELGHSAGVPGAQVRKDLGYVGEYGRSGVGYDARSLAARIEAFLGLADDKKAVIAGAGSLGRALASYPGFACYGLRIVALFDNDPAKIGQEAHGHPVLPIGELTSLAQRLQVQMGIITVPAGAAQEVAEAMSAGGIRAIWNFAPCRLAVPGEVLVQNEDLAAQLATLSHRMAQRGLGGPGAGPDLTVRRDTP